MNTWIGQNAEQARDDVRSLDDVRREFPSWACWERNGLCYARRQHTPHHDYDAHGDDPADLREAILLALSQGGR